MRPRTPLLATGTLALLLVTSACGGAGASGSTSDSGSASGGASGGAAMAEPAPTDARSAVDTARARTVQRRAVVSTGRLELQSRDVGKVRTQVRTVLAAYDGVLADEQTQTDRHGRPDHARLVLRVPSGRFDAAMGELSDLGHLVDSSRTAKDVTTEVIDTDQRVRAQRIGLRRVDQLLGRAGSLRDVLRIEDELTRRQAELDSLVQQQKYLADQTGLATITVSVDRTPAAPAAKKAGTGFLAGLDAGWDGLRAVVTGALTVLGALVPFSPALLLGAAALWWVRRRRGRVVQPGT